MVEFTLDEFHIKLLTEKYENRIKGSVPASIHLPVVNFDSFEGETTFNLLTSLEPITFKKPEEIEEMWDDTYNAWVGQCIINDCFHTACVVFFK